MPFMIIWYHINYVKFKSKNTLFLCLSINLLSQDLYKDPYILRNLNPCIYKQAAKMILKAFSYIPY